MPFDLMSVREINGAADPFYPTPAQGLNQIVFDEADGDAPWTVVVDGMTAHVRKDGEKLEVGRLEEITGALIVTDSRVAFACTHYENGGMWVGLGGALGQVVTGIGDAVSRGIAHASTRGTSMVGHVRYEWLHGIIARDRKGWGSENQLQFIFMEPESKLPFTLLVQLKDRRTRASEVAGELVPHWMRFLASTEEDDAYKRKLLANAASPDSAVAANTGARTFARPPR